MKRGNEIALSVIIATYNRADAALRLLGDLAVQTLPADRFEVIIVDDGSKVPVAERLRAFEVPYRLTVLEQANAGPAAARHRAITAASGAIVVIIDDDMRVEPTFLAAHLAAHAVGTRRVVLGKLAADANHPLRLYERYQLAQLERIAHEANAGRAPLRGSHLYTGNVSMRQADYLAVGGFDQTFRLSEDAELGIRLEAAGVDFVRSEEASALHISDHADLGAWFKRSIAYGQAEARIADKHRGLRDADPWRYLFLVNPISRPLLLFATIAPKLALGIARMIMTLATALAALGAERVALMATTLVYGMCYFAGVRAYAGSRAAARGSLARFLNGAPANALGPLGRVAKFWADVRADHDALRRADAKYGTIARRGWIVADFVSRIGFQMLVAYRWMRLFKSLRLTPFAMLTSRLIRFFYSADIHWNADIAAGAIIVHGVGLVIAPEARVGAGCVLFQHVTLGQSIHPDTRDVGAPTLEDDVHVGPGVALLGPIVVGRATKIAANVVLMRSVPGGSIVESAAPIVRLRTRASVAS